VSSNWKDLRELRTGRRGLRVCGGVDPHESGKEVSLVLWSLSWLAALEGGCKSRKKVKLRRTR